MLKSDKGTNEKISKLICYIVPSRCNANPVCLKMLVLFEHLISECTQQGERDDLFKNHYGVSNEFQEEI